MTQVKNISVAAAKQWLDSGDAILVDVREPAEYAAQHIPGATLVPLGEVCSGKLPDAGGKKLIIHCKGGGRGSSACGKLLTEKPDTELYNLEGGLNAWIQAGYPVADSGRNFLPLDRQVQLAVGFLIFTTTLLGHYINPAFLILTGLFGCGLMFAGATGFCGLALLLAKCPWNQKTKTFCTTEKA